MADAALLRDLGADSHQRRRFREAHTRPLQPLDFLRAQTAEQGERDRGEQAKFRMLQRGIEQALRFRRRQKARLPGVGAATAELLPVDVRQVIERREGHVVLLRGEFEHLADHGEVVLV